MELRYVLTQEDLREALLTAHVARVHRLQRSPAVFALAGVIVCAVLWPPYSALLVPLFGQLAAVALFAFIIGTAGVIVWIRRKRPPRVALPALAEWSVRRQLAASLRRSVLGPITLRVDAGGLWRKNEKDELVVPFSAVRGLLRSKDCFVVQVEHRRLLIAPARAFASPAEASAFCDAISLACGRPIVEVPLPPGT